MLGSYCYVVEHAFDIINVSDPSSPTLTGSYDSLFCSGVAIVGNSAYITSSLYGLQIIDISNPVTPSLVGSYDTPGSGVDVAVVGDYAYVADGESGLQIINISNPASPTLAGSYDTLGHARGVAVAEERVYVADGDNGLSILEVTEAPAAQPPTMEPIFEIESTCYHQTPCFSNFGFDDDSGLDDG